MYVANCSLKYNPEDFTVVNRVLTLAGNTELVGDPFIAHHCGGLLLDGGVFAEKKVDGKYVVCLVDETPTYYIKAKCSLLVDGDAFEIVDGALSLKAVEPSGFDIQWDGNTEGLERVSQFFKISDKVYTEDELVGANGEYIMDDVIYKGTVSLFIPETGDTDFMRSYMLSGDVPETFSFNQVIITMLEDIEFEGEEGVMIVHKGTYFDSPTEGYYTSRIYKE